MRSGRASPLARGKAGDRGRSGTDDRPFVEAGPRLARGATRAQALGLIDTGVEGGRRPTTAEWARLFRGGPRLTLGRRPDAARASRLPGAPCPRRRRAEGSGVESDQPMG